VKSTRAAALSRSDGIATSYLLEGFRVSNPIDGTFSTRTGLDASDTATAKSALFLPKRLLHEYVLRSFRNRPWAGILIYRRNLLSSRDILMGGDNRARKSTGIATTTGVQLESRPQILGSGVQLASKLSGGKPFVFSKRCL
jgi:hypothetical protein